MIDCSFAEHFLSLQPPTHNFLAVPVLRENLLDLLAIFFPSVFHPVERMIHQHYHDPLRNVGWLEVGKNFKRHGLKVTGVLRTRWEL